MQSTIIVKLQLKQNLSWSEWCIYTVCNGILISFSSASYSTKGPVSYTACVFRLCSDYHIQWAPDNKRDPPEEIYSHYLIWHGRRSACIIHALSNICIDPCQGRLDRHSSWQNWPITATKLDICKMHGPGIMHAAAAVGMHECREPNDTHLSAEGPSAAWDGEPNTGSVTYDPLTFECHRARLHCSPSHLVIWISIQR